MCALHQPDTPISVLQAKNFTGAHFTAAFRYSILEAAAASLAFDHGFHSNGLLNCSSTHVTATALVLLELAVFFKDCVGLKFLDVFRCHGGSRTANGSNIGNVHNGKEKNKEHG
jgi:hypothetical protein